MTAATVPRRRPRGRRRLPAPTVAVGIAALALLAGVALGVLGARLGPLVVIALPVVLFAGLWALHRPLVAAVVVPLSLPVGLAPVGGGLQVVQVALVVVAVVVAVHRLGYGVGPLPFPAPAWWAVLLLTLMVLATPGAASLQLAVRQDAGMLAGVLVALALVEACRRLRDLRLVVGLLLAAGLVVCATGLPQLGDVSATAGGAIVTGQLTGSFSEHNQLGSFSAAVVLLAVGMLLGARSRWSRAGAGVVAVLALVTLSLSLSRGAWIGFALGGLVLLVLLPAARRVLMSVGIPVLLLGALLSGFAPDTPQVTIVRERLNTFTDPEANPYDDRPSIWDEAVRQIRASPWTGQGPGSFPVVARRSASEASFAVPDHAHNVLLTVAAESGIPAALVLIGLTLAVGGRVRRAVRSAEPRDAAVVAGVGAALCTFVGQGLVDYTMRNPVLLALIWTLTGLALAAARPVAGRAAGGA